jgi:hypothetical protein
MVSHADTVLRLQFQGQDRGNRPVIRRRERVLIELQNVRMTATAGNLW